VCAASGETTMTSAPVVASPPCEPPLSEPGLELELQAAHMTVVNKRSGRTSLIDAPPDYIGWTARRVRLPTPSACGWAEHQVGERREARILAKDPSAFIEVADLGLRG